MPAEGATLLDEIQPTYDVATSHAIWIAAPPSRVYEVVRAVDLGRPLVVRALVFLRAVPARLAAWLDGRAPSASPVSTRSVRGVRFTIVAEQPGVELVLGIRGRFWTPDGGVVPTSAEQFHQPPPAGLAQALWSFRLIPHGSGTHLFTETRIQCADPATRRRFLRYWSVIRMGSSVIRRSILHLVQRTAEGGIR
jgi:hypothetical protein